MTHETEQTPPADAGRLDQRVRRLAVEHDAFLQGVCVALQVVVAMDCPVTWGEIVVAVGVDQMLRYAAHVEPDEWELAGFKKYARYELGRGRPRRKTPNV